MTKIIHTSAAKADLANIWSYIAAENPAAADKLLAQIDVAFDLIGRTPEIGFPVDEIKLGLRCKPVKRTILSFTASSATTSVSPTFCTAPGSTRTCCSTHVISSSSSGNDTSNYTSCE